MSKKSLLSAGLVVETPLHGFEPMQLSAWHRNGWGSDE